MKIKHNPVLTQHAADYADAVTYYAAQNLFPRFLTGESSGHVPKYVSGQRLSTPTDIRRAPASAYKRGSLHDGDETPFVCREFGFEVPVDDKHAKVYGGSLASGRSATIRSMDVILKNHEIRCHKLLTDPTNGVPVSNLATPWTSNSSDPTGDIKAAQNSTYDAIDVVPNTLILGMQLYNILTQHAGVKALLSGDERNIIRDRKQLADLLELEDVIVATGKINSANKGQEIAPLDIWDGMAILVHTDTDENLDSRTFGRTMTSTVDTSRRGFVTETYREEEKRSTIYRARHDVSEVITCPEAATIFTGVL